jgi:hypothetical protein
MEPISIVMFWEKETKNTHKYSVMQPTVAATGAKSPVSEVYLQKSHLRGQPAHKIVKVTVEGA